jgi:hypothetical protein
MLEIKNRLFRFPVWRRQKIVILGAALSSWA